jgi:hypothetical protein
VTTVRSNTLLACAIAVLAAALVVLVLSACGDDGGGTAPDLDPSTALPGTFVPSQGRGHFNRTFNPDTPPLPFCDGVATDESAGAASVAVPTPVAGGPNSCYASNPPSSGWHLPSQRNVEVVPGARINIPPDPDVYPPDIEIPREAIPHVLEHAGVFVAYNCADGDAACAHVVTQLERIANDRIDNDDRVVMARSSDLPAGTIGMSSWTRVETFPHAEFTQDRVVNFISTHSCRFDPEGFC